MRTQVFSYGGGWNTAAIAVLIGMGKLPRPDYIVIADTGREATSTWDYLHEVMAPYLARVGLRVDIAPHELATVDLYAHNGDLLLPMYTQHGKLPTFCSSEWKEYVIRRWLRAQGVQTCDLWLGYTLDEIERVKPARVKWTRRIYPLLDLMLTRQDCETILREAGLPFPAKSACWMCPHRNNQEWRYLRDEYPQDWQAAIALEKTVRQQDAGVWLHADRVPLSQADIETDSTATHTQCGLGMCYL